MSTIPRKVFIQVDPIDEQVSEKQTTLIALAELFFKVIILFTAILGVCDSCDCVTPILASHFVLILD